MPRKKNTHEEENKIEIALLKQDFLNMAKQLQEIKHKLDNICDILNNKLEEKYTTQVMCKGNKSKVDLKMRMLEGRLIKLENIVSKINWAVWLLIIGQIANIIFNNI